MHITLASLSNIKYEALLDSISAVGAKNWTITRFTVSDMEDGCSQPLDDGGLIVCRNRIERIKQNKGILAKTDYIISVENFIDTVDEVDIALCICYNVAESWETVAYSNATPLLDSPNSPLLQKLLGDNKHKYGATETYGKLLNKQNPEIQHDNWFKDGNRKELITETLIGLIKPIYADINQVKLPLSKKFRYFPDFPKPGIQFADWNDIFLDSSLVTGMTEYIAKKYLSQGVKIHYVIGLESRGYFIALPLAMQLEAGFLPMKKPGKTPGPTIKQDYTKEYGVDTLELRCDLPPGNVLVVDDVLATGGSLEAAINLAKIAGHKVIDAITITDVPALRPTRKPINVRVILSGNYDP